MTLVFLFHAFLILLLTATANTVSLTSYSLCPASFIAADLDQTPSCLPPEADCLCYIDAFAVESIAIDIASHCNSTDVTDTASIMQSNCAALSHPAAVNSDEFTALAFYPASDTIQPESTTVYLATIPGVYTTDSALPSTSLIPIQYSFSGVTTVPGPNTANTATTSIGPLSLSSLATTAAPSISATKKSSAMGRSQMFRSREMVMRACFAIAVLLFF